MQSTVTPRRYLRKRQFLCPKPQVSPTKRKRLLEHDHGYSSSEISAKVKMHKLSNKVNVLRQQLCRNNKNIKNLKELLLTFKEKQLIAIE